MTTRLDDALDGREDNYLLPFIWQRGEPEAVIREEMARIDASGIRAVCVEARPHRISLGRSGGATWTRSWTRRARGMRVWILDDDHFPTGHAAGRVAGAPAELRRLFLKERHVDTIGPQRDAAFPIRPWLLRFSPSFHPEPIEGALVTAVAARRDPASDALLGEPIDVTARVQDDVLRWDVPEGHWRIFLVLASPDGGAEGQQDYVNPLVGESVRILIDTVYEAFYQRYPSDFGKTFAGFFSDEPGFYNDPTIFDYQSKLGKKASTSPGGRICQGCSTRRSARAAGRTCRCCGTTAASAAA